MLNRGHEYLSFIPIRRIHFFLIFVTALALLVVVDLYVLHQVQPPPALLESYSEWRTTREGFVTNYKSIENSSEYEIPSPEERAVVTALFSEGYIPAVLTLGHSLRKTHISARRIVIYFPERLSPRSICQLQAVGWELHPIERIPPPDEGKDLFYRYQDNYTKLQIWALDKIGIKTVFFLDGDTLVVRNFDEIWSLPFEFAAVPDVYHNQLSFALKYNGGVLFLRTSSAVFEDMTSLIGSEGYHHDEAEQGLLNMYFGPQVALLPYIYNANLMIKQRKPVVWKSIEKDTRVIHYTTLKPFNATKREKARKGKTWEAEMEIWDSAWRDAYTEDIRGKCLLGSDGRSITD